MGGAIPWSAIHEYAAAHGIRDEERFVRLIRAMDREAMNRHREKD